MTQSERVKKIRKTLDLTMEKFGIRLGVGKTAISGIETGRRNLTEQMIKSICREYKVNEDWLRTGAGGDENMFIPEDMAYMLNIGELGNEKNEFKKFYLNMMMNLPDEYWNYVYNEFKKFSKKDEE